MLYSPHPDGFARRLHYERRVTRDAAAPHGAGHNSASSLDGEDTVDRHSEQIAVRTSKGDCGCYVADHFLELIDSVPCLCRNWNHRPRLAHRPGNECSDFIP